MNFVDTNYFLRFFVGEPHDQRDDAKALFQKAAEGKIDLCTSLIVFFEVYWVASSFYGFKKDKAALFLQNMLKMEFIRLENRDLLMKAVSLYESSAFDLEDAYNLAYARSVSVEEFVTFDVKVKKKFTSP